jgi:dihydroneopterin aldolase / 2-amino-4-hydroxy-6-hydroxymethyldihydropteridine diphosphokinase
MDKITLKNMKFYAYHGVFDEEQENGQDFFVDVELFADLREPGYSDVLAHTLDYGEAYEIIKNVTLSNKFKLIEKLAQSIADAMLSRFAAIDSIVVRVRKPNAPINGEFDYMEVEISRKSLKHKAFLSLGSNMWDREGNIRSAIERLGSFDDIKLNGISGIYETEPVGYLEQDMFYNAVVEVSTCLKPHELLKRVLGIENELGRKRTVRWGPRTIDIDILTYDDMKMDTEDLILPHPRMFERAFVLVPLMEICKDPCCEEMVLNCSGRETVRYVKAV